MAVSLDYWDSEQNTTKREQRLASLFLGHRFVLEILAEINRGFKYILEAHSDVLCQHYSKHPFKPPIYRVINHRDDKMAYLVGTIHHRIMTKRDYAVVSGCWSYPGAMLNKIHKQAECIPENLKTIVKKCDVLAFERTPQEQRVDQLEIQTIVARNKPKCSDNFGTKKRMDSQDFVLAEGCGLDNSISLLIDGFRIRQESLESRKSNLAAIEELCMFPEVRDFEYVMQGMDLFTGESEEQCLKQWSLRDLHSCNSYQNKHMKWRNPPMAEKLLQLMEENTNVTACVGVLHLYGEYGLLNLLTSDDIAIEELGSSTLQYSYDPNWGITFTRV